MIVERSLDKSQADRVFSLTMIARGIGCVASLDKFKKVSIEAAKAGGEILLSYFGRVRDVSRKERAGLVTEADRESEEKIISVIKAAFPEHSILAEESGREQRPGPYQWIIDPLDGTTNYAHQIPIFCVSIALEKEGEVVLGTVWDPLGSNLYTTVRGLGAFKNRRRLKVSKVGNFEDSLIATGFAYQSGDLLKESLEILRNFMLVTHGIRRSGSAVWDLCHVAEGHFDAFWEKNLQSWDVAAGKLLVEEAGGKVTRYDGKPATIYDQQVVASNGRLHSKMLETISASR